MKRNCAEILQEFITIKVFKAAKIDFSWSKSGLRYSQDGINQPVVTDMCVYNASAKNSSCVVGQDQVN